MKYNDIITFKMRGLVDSSLRIIEAEKKYTTEWTCYLHTAVNAFEGKELAKFWDMVEIFRDELRIQIDSQIAIDNLLSSCHRKEDYERFNEWVRFAKTWHNLVNLYKDRLFHVVGFKDEAFSYYCDALVLVGKIAYDEINKDMIYGMSHNQFLNRIVEIEEVQLTHSLRTHNDYILIITQSCKEWFKKMCEVLND